MTHARFTGILIKRTGDGFKNLISELNKAAAAGYTLRDLCVVEDKDGGRFAALLEVEEQQPQAPVEKAPRVYANFFDD